MTRPASPQEIAAALGNGKQQRTSGGWKTLCPLHNDSNPSLIIYEKGDKDGKPWAQCASCGTSGDLYKAIEDKTGLHFAARRSLSDFTTPNTEKTRDRKVKAVYPSQIPWHPVHLKGVPPSQHWEYRNADNELMFVAARYDFQDGKQFRQYSMVFKGGQPVWHGTNQCRPAPLYNLREVLDRPNDPVLVVEGEKAADYAKGLPEFKDFVVTTFAAGSKSWKKTDWEPVANRQVWLWPDADEVGISSFVEIGKYLWSVASDVQFAHVPKFLPKGWDLADPVPENWSISAVKWKPAYKPDRTFLLSNVTPANYIEVFDSMYHVYHDGTYQWTVSKQYIDYMRGRPIKVDSTPLMMKITHQHEAWHSCRVEVGEDNFESAIKVWATSKLQNLQHLGGFDFRPDIQSDVIEDGYLNELNTFTGFTCTPTETGSCELFKTFLLEVICDNDNEGYRYLWNFLSHMFQYPHEKPDVAVMLNGEKGTGKSFFMSMIHELLGGSGGYGYSVPSSLVFKGNFNGSYVASTLALFVNEWQNTTSMAIENNIKSFITDDTVEVQIKYRNNYQARNFTRIFGASNHEHMANVTAKERRYSFFNVSEKHIQESDYFKAIHNQLKQGGFGKLMHEFMETKVDRALVREPYRNHALQEQKELTKTPSQKLAYKMLLDGEIFLRTLDDRRDVESLYQVSSEDWAKRSIPMPQGLLREFIDRYYMGKEAYGRNSEHRSPKGVMSWMMAEAGHDKYRTTCHISHRGSSKHVQAFRIPPLEQCRQYYANKVGLSYEVLFDDDRNQVIPLRPIKDDPDVPF